MTKGRNPGGTRSFAALQAESGLTDRQLEKESGVSSRTLFRLKHEEGYLPRREDVMQRLVGALGVEVDEVSEFVEARRRRVIESERKAGMPPEVEDELEVMQHTFTLHRDDYSQRTMQHAALRLLRDVVFYLVRSGRAEAVRRVVEEALQEEGGGHGGVDGAS